MHYLRALGYRLPGLEQTGSNFGADLEHETPSGIERTLTRFGSLRPQYCSIYDPYF